ncbi:MAG: acyl-CoA dehydrogenase family protein [Actinobacteria bacterium]|nr:acyl-CoA dehydrogenase family protein [Actinomycetota bacterium]
MPRSASRWSTHEVINQPPPLLGWDVAAYPPLLEALECAGAGWYADELHRLGRLAGGAQAQGWAVDADTNPPVLRTHDRAGHRIDEVDYHPAYHQLMTMIIDAGLTGGPWTAGFAPDDAAPGAAHAARAAGFFVWCHTELGHGCPASMTHAVIPALRAAPELASQWEPGLVSRVYDPTLTPPATKPGLTAGMAMTEKQGGSDVRANTTAAQPTADDMWRLTGHKWFCSAPMSDVFLVLARAPGGLTCFLLPRVLPDGTRNAVRIQRLKDKLGNRANASSEVEFADALAWRLGDEGRGISTIIEMVVATRVDCVIGAALTTRHAVAHAVHHVQHREAFGHRLVEQPAMTNVVADLAAEAEAMTAVAVRLAAAFGRAQAGDERERLFARLAVPVSKYWTTKRSVAAVAEALECLGGNGYVEESGLPRLYREAPLYSIWEGAGNVQVLDVLRAVVRTPDAVDIFLEEVGLAAGGDARLDAAVAELRRELHDDAQLEYRARRVSGLMAAVLQGSLLVRHAPAAVADAWCATRLDGGHDLFGTLPEGSDTSVLLDRATPARL